MCDNSLWVEVINYRVNSGFVWFDNNFMPLVRGKNGHGIKLREINSTYARVWGSVDDKGPDILNFAAKLVRLNIGKSCYTSLLTNETPRHTSYILIFHENLTILSFYKYLSGQLLN